MYWATNKHEATASCLGDVRLFLTFFLLHVGKSLLLPLVIAASIAYLISILAHAISAFQFRGMRVPSIFAKILALAFILVGLGMIINLITINIANVLKVAPEYQSNLVVWYQQNVEVKLKETQWLGLSEVPNLKQTLRQLDLGAYLQNLSGTVRDLISRVGIVIVYLIFLLLEQRTFSSKVEALVIDPKRRDDIFELLGKIRQDIRIYIGIKVLTSLATGLLSYLVLSLVELILQAFGLS